MKGTLALGIGGALILGGCAGMMSPAHQAGGRPMAKAVLSAASGSSVTGTVTFFKTGSGQVEVVADIQGLTPGKHGFHVHDKGDCSDPKAASAGGHFNPEMGMHGSPDSGMRHVGDLGNLVADSSGHAVLDWKDKLLSFSGPHSVIGKSVIVHAGEDDLKSQPAGNSGNRIACGVIEEVK